MTVVNSSVQDITSDTLLSQSKPKIKDNFDDLLANDVAIESRVTSLEGGSFASATKTKFTAEGGLAIKLTNKTGSASVKGSVVSAATGTDNAFILQTNEYDAIGVVYENSIADAAECWVVVTGIAEVLLKDFTAATRGYIALCADTDGRFISTAPSGSPPLSTDTHFKEIGHVIETKNSGTNVLAKCVLHFN